MKTLHTIYTSFAKRNITTLRFFFVIFLTLIVGTKLWGADEVYKTAKFGSLYNSQATQSYSGNSWYSTNDDFRVDITNANNNQNGWSYIKIGGKNGAYTGTITTHEVIDEPITKVTLTIDGITLDKITSITLYTKTATGSYTSAGTFSKETGEQTVSLASPTANLFYKIEVVCAKGSSNGLITISQVDFYKSNAPVVPTYEITWNNGGRGIKPTSPTSASSLELPTLSATGYEHTGWKANVAVKNTSTGTTINANTLITNGTNVTLTQATTFTAQWSAKTYTITLNNQFANIAGTTSITATYNSNANLINKITIPQKNYHNFGGYYTQTNGNGTQLIDSEGNINANAGSYTDANKLWKYDDGVTLYAKWTEKQLTNYRTSCGSAAILKSITVSGQTTTYNVGDSFSFDGTCTATYDDESTKTVTHTSVSSPDMSTAGTKTVTVTYTEGDVTATTTYDITVNVVKTATSLTWSADSYTATIASESNVFPTITITPEAIKESVTYSSSDETVATIDAVGNIRLLAAGTTTITASYAGDEDYNASSDTYELTVEKSTNCRWEEVTIDDIEYGDEVVIAMTNGATTWALDHKNAIGDHPKAQVVTVKSGIMLENPAQYDIENLKWNVSKVGTNYILYPNGDTERWLYGVSSYIKVGTGENNAFMLFKQEGHECFAYIYKTEGYYVGIGTANSQDAWKNFTTSNHLTYQTLKFYKKVCLPENEYWVDFDLENVTCISDLPKIVDASAEDLLLYFTTEGHYELPAIISVKMGGTEVENNNESYIWSQNEGGFLLKKAGVTDNLTISIAAQLKKYSVSFNMNGQGSAIQEQQITAGATVSTPTQPTDDSHNFIGWFTDKDCTTAFDFSTPIYAPTIIYAKWEIKTFTITYAKGSPVEEITGSHDPGTKTYGTGYTLADESFYREGHKQTGWAVSDGGEKAYDLLGTYGGNADITLYPVWTKVHTVTWMASGEQYDKATYLDGLTLELPETKPVPCQGSAFMGWTAAKDYFNATTAPTYVTAGNSVTTDATYYAVYAEEPEGEEDATYTLVTTANDFTDGIYVIAAKSNDYFYFINGQYVSDGLGVETTGLASNLVNDNSFAASILPGGAVELDIEDDGDPLRDNYYFISYYDEVNSKWLYLDDNGTKQTILWTDADEVYTYLPIFDNGKYYLQSGSGAKISQNGSNKASFIRNYASTGSFYNSLYFFKKSAGSIIYTNYSTTCTPTYYITYDLNGGEGGCENGSVPADENYTICANIPTKTGYDFVGWSTADDNEAEFLKADVEAGQAIIENVSNNVELYAVWEANTYEITWWSNGVEYTTTSHTFDTELQLLADPYTCYGAKTFIGWTEAPSVNVDGSDITYINENTNPSEDKTYYAVFADEEVGEPETLEATLSFTDQANRTSQTSEQQVWEQNGITLTNNQASSANPVADYFDPARFYAGSSINITAPGNITKIVFACTNGYATAMKNSAGNSASVDGNNVTVNLNGSSNTFNIASVTAQIRLSSLTVTYQSTPKTILTNYTTEPSGCPEFEVAENAYVTSANGQSVKVNVPVTATNFTNDMAITAAVEDGNFSVANVSAVTDGACTVTLAYKPTASNTTESATVTLTAKAGDNEVTSTTFTLNGRSLPETFAVVAKVGNMWYALPEVGYEAGKHATAYPVEVDNIADPIAVTSAVANNAAWSLRQVYEAQKSNAQHDRYATSGTNFVLENKQGTAKLLNASAPGDKGSNNYLLTAAQYDNYYSTNPGLYEWTPTTTDLETYTLTNVQRTDKQINISTHAVFGLHASDVVTNQVRFLPIQGTYTTLAIQVVEWKENSVVVMYNGNPAQTASISVNGGTAQTATLSAVQKDIAVHELPATGLAANPGQMLKIAIGSEQLLLSIPYIISESKVDKNILPGSNVAERQAVAKVSDLVILKGGILTADGAKTNSYKFRNVTIYGGGKLVVPADKGFGVNTLTLRIGGVTAEGNYDYVYPEFELNINYDKAFTNTSAVINLDYVTTKSQYYTFVAPFEVKTKDIKYPVDIYGSNVKAANRGSFEFQYYDGEARAAGEMGWKVVEEDATEGATLTAHQGYTFYGMPMKVSVNGGTSTRQKFGIHRIPMSVTAANVMSHENSEQTTIVSAYPSQHNINAGWNLIGNPYMATITGLNNNSIQTGTIVLVDDRWQWSDAGSQASRFIVFPSNDGEWYYTSQASNATLPAFKNFFVQIGDEDATALSIPRNIPAAQAPARRAAQDTEEDIELAIVLEKDAAHADQLDFLVNDAYTAVYDYNADFTKMMNNTQLNLFGLLMEDNLSFVAVDHLTAKTDLAIGYQVPQAGEYTLRLSEKPYVMWSRVDALYVTDHEVYPEVTTNLLEDDYTFQVGNAETNITRFTISIIPSKETSGTTTGVDNLLHHDMQTQKFIYNDQLYILRDGVVYDAMGQRIMTINK